MTIYIANFNYRLQDTDLNRLFSIYGRVEWATVIKEKATRRSKGFGFVQMPDDRAGNNAIAALHGTVVGGRTIVVTAAHNKEVPFKQPAQEVVNDEETITANGLLV